MTGTKKRAALVVAMLAMAAMLGLTACGGNAASSSSGSASGSTASASSSAQGGDGYFASWEADSPTVKLVRDYVDAYNARCDAADKSVL
jgi:ABC-type glycerol-3-phosphate transport system substrate-binding protein